MGAGAAKRVPAPASGATFCAVTDAFIDTPEAPPESDDPRESRLTIIAAILLGIAATFTAFSAYQAALSDGDALKGYTESNSQLSDGNYFYSRGDAKTAQDYQQWTSYNVSYQELLDGIGSEAVKDQLYFAMDENLQAAVDWWVETEEALTPFDDLEGNPYVIDDFAAGEDLVAQSKVSFAAGKAADDKGDEFELASVLLALCLFFSGIATLFRRRGVVLALLGGGFLILVAGTAQMIVGMNA